MARMMGRPGTGPFGIMIGGHGRARRSGQPGGDLGNDQLPGLGPACAAVSGVPGGAAARVPARASLRAHAGPVSVTRTAVSVSASGVTVMVR